MENHYHTLGVSEDATIEEITTSYRKLARQNHPDTGGDESKFAQISTAYNHLSKNREIYDLQLKGCSDVEVVEIPDIYHNVFFTLAELYCDYEIRISYEREFTKNGNTLIKEESMLYKHSAGWQEDTVIFKGKGHVINGKRSNLIIQFAIKDEHNKFIHNEETNTIDVFTEVYYTVEDSIYGLNKSIELPNGKYINISIGADKFKPNGYFVLDGQGINGGNVIVELRYEAPTLHWAKKHNLKPHNTLNENCVVLHIEEIYDY